MSDHEAQPLNARAMIRAHAYPVLAAISTLSLLTIAVLMVPGAVRDHRYNLCIDEQVRLRASERLRGQGGPGKLIYLRAVEHCEGR